MYAPLILYSCLLLYYYIMLNCYIFCYFIHHFLITVCNDSTLITLNLIHHSYVF